MVTDWASRRALLSPDRTAVYDLEQGRGYTYLAMRERTARLAGVLAGMGIGAGDRVGILARNGLPHIDLWLLSGYHGTAVAPLNWRLPAAELLPLAQGAGLRALYCAQEFWAAGEEIARETGQRLLPLGEPYEQALAGARELPPAPPEEADVAMLLFTGGTTGVAKGVRITHRQIFWNAVNTVTSWELSARDVAPVLTPFYHTGGYHVLTTPLYHAGGTTLLPEGFSAPQALSAVREHRASLLFLVPTMFASLLAADPRPEDFASVRFAISGGAACPPYVAERFGQLGVRFRQGYGLTEVGPNCFWMPEGAAAAHPGSVGLPVFHLEVRIAGEAGEALPPGSAGELWMRGPTVADGYDGRPAETAAVFGQDGFCRTGDLAVQDADGFVQIVGRRKEMFISGGENVYPIEVEAAIYAHPDVLLCAVVGVPHPHWGEVGVAFVQPREGASLAAGDLLSFLGGRLARYKLPKAVEVLENLPLTGAGKVAKEALRAEYLRRSDAREGA